MSGRSSEKAQTGITTIYLFATFRSCWKTRVCQCAVVVLRGKMSKIEEVFLAEWQTLPEKLSFQNSQVSGRILAKTELLSAGFITLL